MERKRLLISDDIKILIAGNFIASIIAFFIPNQRLSLIESKYLFVYFFLVLGFFIFMCVTKATEEHQEMKKWTSAEVGTLLIAPLLWMFGPMFIFVFFSK